MAIRRKPGVLTQFVRKKRQPYGKMVCYKRMIGMPGVFTGLIQRRRGSKEGQKFQFCRYMVDKAGVNGHSPFLIEQLYFPAACAEHPSFPEHRFVRSAWCVRIPGDKQPCIFSLKLFIVLLLEQGSQGFKCFPVLFNVLLPFA